MTDEQLEKLAVRVAKLVLDGLIEKQKEWDQQFTTDLNNLQQDGFGNAKLVSEEELILAEIARLMTLLSSYEQNEQYEKAAIVHNKLKILENKLNKL
jgi:hypothetical protein